MGTDIARRGLQYIRDIIKDKPEYAGVELKRQSAADAVEGPQKSFDIAVIRNSVVEYFPDEEY